MRLISLECPNCGSHIEFNENNMQYYCGRCGSTLSLDIKSVEKLLIEKEKTKRIKMKEDTKRMLYHSAREVEKQERMQRYKEMISILGIVIVWIGWMVLIAVLGYNHIFNMSTEIAWSIELVSFFTGDILAMILSYIYYTERFVLVRNFLIYALLFVIFIYFVEGGKYDFFGQGSSFTFITWVIGFIIAYVVITTIKDYWDMHF